MNVTELARRIKVSTNELRDLFPRFGYDIGRKAIKVDGKVAEKIIELVKTDSSVIQEYRAEKNTEDEVEEEKTTTTQNKITIPPVITVRDFATMLDKPVASVIQELMKNGILANLNEQIDYETANIIAQDFGFATSTGDEEGQVSTKEVEKIEDLFSGSDEGLESRPPIVVVMGHVDHGKTQLLDSIRKTDVISQESGGITQHIGAYQVQKNNKKITFIDTPGHEAFTAMRSRGARVADIAILVIAADDGIKPQTEEAIQIIESAKIPFVVAINKIDKPDSDIEKIKQQLAQKNLLPEDWGGKIITVPISAKTGQGIEDLLESLLLIADVEKNHIQADPSRKAIGTIIESHVDKGEGPVATVIIQSGTLKKGDVAQVGKIAGKIRAMKYFNGEDMTEAAPATPVKILGLKDAPEVGDLLKVTNEEQSLNKIKKQLRHEHDTYRDKQTWKKTQTKRDEEGEKESKSVNIILKADVVGSQEAIIQSLETITEQDIKVTIVKKGLGNIRDIDVLEAESTGSVIYGFNVKINQRAEELAKEKELPVHTFTIIYDLIDSVKKEVEKLVTYQTEVIGLGRVKVLEIFHTEKSNMIIGGLITKGKAEQGASATVIRDDKGIGQVTIAGLQQGKQDIKEIPSGTECGLQIKGNPIIQKDDILEVYKEELKK